jgi:hypothetical protein
VVSIAALVRWTTRQTAVLVRHSWTSMQPPNSVAAYEVIVG